ncbi:roadblock/LC7 domain-containing protein [Salinactinospora qingdaonensis]|uniref:Roadblock/LC7 domain-containing protein n=1 Tax=Salinactinospora qingdaonensis TaxID=702744 RepID=A0ABP7GDQ3_9ACTN
MTTSSAAVESEELAWLVSNFVGGVSGVEHAVVVSSDGLLLTGSHGFAREAAERLSAIVSGLHSLAAGAARLFGKGGCEQVIVRMGGGHLVVMGISDGSHLAVLAGVQADLKVVAYQMMRLVEDAGHALTPQVREHLRQRTEAGGSGAGR